MGWLIGRPRFGGVGEAECWATYGAISHSSYGLGRSVTWRAAPRWTRSTPAPDVDNDVPAVVIVVAVVHGEGNLPHAGALTGGAARTPDEVVLAGDAGDDLVCFRIGVVVVAVLVERAV